jgi:hypothetical protein
MARRHVRPHLKGQLLVTRVGRRHLPGGHNQRLATGARGPRYLGIFSGIPSGQGFDSIQQVFLACDSRDLIAQLAVLEKE